jgi:hypothetical protein
VSAATVTGALRRFLPEFLNSNPPLSQQQRRAIWAITHCRTPALGGRSFACERCGQVHFAFHSCNHKACPQCGREATARWIDRELGKLVGAPYFLVTFTLPSQLRGCFFGPFAKEAYDMFFAASSQALAEKLAAAKGLRAHISGFTAVLHTWNQRIEFHPHLHFLVPGAGLDVRGKVVRVRQADYLVRLPHLQAAFRHHMRRQFEPRGWHADPQVWSKDWGVHIQPAGSGAAALKYLGAYVARTAISDGRIFAVHERGVTFRWKDRSDHNRSKLMTLTGSEFVRRYLRHVLPSGLRSIRYYGFCHPAAKAKRQRIQIHTGMPFELNSRPPPDAAPPGAAPWPRCPTCDSPMRLTGSILPPYRTLVRQRGAPAPKRRRNQAISSVLP